LSLHHRDGAIINQAQTDAGTREVTREAKQIQGLFIYLTSIYGGVSERNSSPASDPISVGAFCPSISFKKKTSDPTQEP